MVYDARLSVRLLGDLGDRLRLSPREQLRTSRHQTGELPDAKQPGQCGDQGDLTSGLSGEKLDIETSCKKGWLLVGEMMIHVMFYLL